MRDDAPLDDELRVEWAPEMGEAAEADETADAQWAAWMARRVSANRWRFLTLALTADERRALVALAETQRRALDDTAVWLLRVALEDRGLLERV